MELKRRLYYIQALASFISKRNADETCSNEIWQICTPQPKHGLKMPHYNLPKPLNESKYDSINSESITINKNRWARSTLEMVLSILFFPECCNMHVTCLSCRIINIHQLAHACFICEHVFLRFYFFGIHLHMCLSAWPKLCLTKLENL